MTKDTNPVSPSDQGKPDAPTCRHCSMPRAIRNGALACRVCDEVLLMPIHREPGA